MSNEKQITVLGAGAGCCALAFHLTQTGYEVMLYQDEGHLTNIELLMKTGQIKAVDEHDGYQAQMHGAVKISCVTTNIRLAVEFSNVLIMCLPSFAQVTVFKAALPYLTRDHIFVSLPGNFAIFDYLKRIRESGLKIDSPLAHVKETPVPCVFVESSTIPYACRKINKDNIIFIGGIKKFICAGVYPQHKADSTFKELDNIFGKSMGVKIERVHLLEATFYNCNIIQHPAIAIYNAGQIKTQSKTFYFYKDGVSSLVCKIMGALDKEVLQIGSSVGFNLESYMSYYRRYYGDNSPNNTIGEFFHGAHFLHFVKAPTDLSGRFISEDLQYGLLPMIRYIAKKDKVPTPVAEALIVSAQCMLGRNIDPLREIPGEEWDIIIYK